MIGLFGGTFDPVHCGHIALCLHLMNELPLSEIKFIPCKQPLLKSPTCATNEQRLQMLKIALAPYPQLSIDLSEINRATPSYTVDTLEVLREIYPHESLAFIMGEDAYLSLNQWHDYEKIFKLAHIIVVNRPSTTQLSTNEINLTDDHALTISSCLRFRHSNLTLKQMQEKTAEGLIFQPISPNPLASSDLRQRMRAQENVAEALPPGVWEYIKQEKLYGIS